MYEVRTKKGYELIMSLLLTLSICIIGSSVCASSGYLAGKTVRVIGPHSAGWNQTIKKNYSELEKEYGFKIELDLVPWSSYIEKAMMAVQGPRASYDVINANGEWVLAPYVSGGNIFPLDSFVKKDNYDLDSFDPFLLSLVYWPKDQSYKFEPIFSDWQNGRLMGLPSFPDTTPLSYRKDWLLKLGIQDPPENWKEFLDIAIKLTRDTDGDGRVDQWGWATPGAVRGGQLWDEWMIILNSYGVDILNEKGMPAFNTSKGEKATQFLVDLYQKYEVVPPGTPSFTQGHCIDLFKSGKIGMIKSWYNDACSFVEVLGVDKVGYTTMPIKERVAARAMTWAYVIPKNARDPRLSWEFMKLASSFGSQKKLMPTLVPSRKDARVYAKKNYPGAALSIVLDTIFRGDAAIQPMVPNVLELSDEAVSPPIQNALTGRTSVREALDIAEDNAIKLMKGFLESL